MIVKKEEKRIISDFILMLIMIIAIETIYISSIWLNEYLSKRSNMHTINIEKMYDAESVTENSSVTVELPPNLTEIINEEEL